MRSPELKNVQKFNYYHPVLWKQPQFSSLDLLPASKSLSQIDYIATLIIWMSEEGRIVYVQILNLQIHKIWEDNIKCVGTEM